MGVATLHSHNVICYTCDISFAGVYNSLQFISHNGIWLWEVTIYNTANHMSQSQLQCQQVNHNPCITPECVGRIV